MTISFTNYLSEINNPSSFAFNLVTPEEIELEILNVLMKNIPRNIVQISHLSNSFESKQWFTSTANQLNSVGYSVSASYFTKI